MAELKKISAYVPEELYDCLEKDKNEGGISFSQAIIAALANHYNLEVTVGKSGHRITLGGETATVQRVEALEQKFSEFSSSINEQLEQVLSAIQNSRQTVSRNKIEHQQSVNKNGIVKNQSINRLLDNKNEQIECVLPLQEQLLLETEEKREGSKLDSDLLPSIVDIKPLTGRLLGLRLSVAKTTPFTSKRRLTLEQFKKWSSEKDPNSIFWIPDPDGSRYLPSEETTEDQLLELRKWLSVNK